MGFVRLTWIKQLFACRRLHKRPGETGQSKPSHHDWGLHAQGITLSPLVRPRKGSWQGIVVADGVKAKVLRWDSETDMLLGDSGNVDRLGLQTAGRRRCLQ